MTISAKLFSILTTGLRRRFLKFSHRYIMETGNSLLAQTEVFFLSGAECLEQNKFVKFVKVSLKIRLYHCHTPQVLK